MTSFFSINAISTYCHVAGVGLGANLANEGSRGGLGELGDSLLGEAILEGALALVELLVEDNGGLLDASSLGKLGVRGGAEEEGVPELLSDSGVGSVAGLVVGGEVANEDDLVGSLELLVGLGSLEKRDGRERLLGHVGDDGAGLAGTLVGLVVVDTTEDLESGVSFNAIALAQLLLLSAVNLCEGNVLVLELGSSLLVLGRKGLAVSAPGSEDW